jgi:D-alanyl-D-alanine carboxypeptidase
MANTTYVNASGLPDDGQVTTAKDQALLGRAIYERFPKYYRYFSTETFVYGGEVMRNHNHLLGAVEGVDGIKTGYTRASGFNLITSVHRDNRHIIAVILGGKTASERDAHMRKLITTYTKPAIFPGVALVRPQSPVLDERRNSSSDPIQALIGTVWHLRPSPRNTTWHSRQSNSRTNPRYRPTESARLSVTLSSTDKAFNSSKRPRGRLRCLMT